jgi:hypothetical protein
MKNKLALALLIAPITTIGLAVPAHADAAEDDADFLAGLKQAGITYNNPERAVEIGRAVCDHMNHDVTGADVVKSLRDANPGLTLTTAAKFAVVGAGTYCPDQLGGKPAPMKPAPAETGLSGDAGAGGAGGGG